MKSRGPHGPSRGKGERRRSRGLSYYHGSLSVEEGSLPRVKLLPASAGKKFGLREDFLTKENITRYGRRCSE